uniref:Putative tail protein n=2 Tax=viral metagenome TaxID=1070528 RepID=A0A6M3JB62_9ZZZZ
MKKLLCVFLLLLSPVMAQAWYSSSGWYNSGGIGRAVYDYETFYIEEGIDGASAPAVLSTITSTHTVFIRDFDDAADEDVDFIWQAPNDIKADSTISYRVGFFITNATAPSAEGVAFQLAGASIGTGDALGATLGTAIATTAAARSDAQYDLVYTSWSAAVTITNLAAGETAIMTLNRDVSDAADDYAQDVGVYCLQIKYSRSLDGV